MANEIVTELRLELDKFRQDLKDAQKAGEESAKSAAEHMGGAVEEGLGHVVGHLKTEFLAIGAAIISAFAGEKIIEAASESQVALATLNSAMQAAGTYTDAASKSFLEFAERLQGTTKYSHDVIETNAAMLVSLGRLSGDGLERATQAALDLASGMNIDVQTAFTAVSKAAEGNVASLSRYGIYLHSTGDASRDLGRALEQINGLFGGSAHSQIDTYAGAMSQLSNAFRDIQASLGDFWIRSPLVIAAIKAVTSEFQKFEEIIKGQGNTDVIGKWVKDLVNLGQTITQYVIPPLNLLYNIGKVAFQALATGVSLIVLAISKELLTLLDAAAIFTSKFDGVRETLRASVEDQGNVLADLANKTAGTMDNIFDFSFTGKMEDFLGKVQTMVAKFGKTLAELPGHVKKPADVITKQMEQLRAALQQVVLGQMVSIVSGGLQQIGAALGHGQGAWVKFRNFAYSALGDMCIKMGETMLAQSAAFAALSALIANPFTSAAASIAFGVLLIGLGGALKAAAAEGASDGASTATGGASGGGGVAGGAYAPPVDQGQGFQQSGPKDAGTKVEVHIHGNVLDRRETGLAIAEVINESFGSNGVTFATGGA